MKLSVKLFSIFIVTMLVHGCAVMDTNKSVDERRQVVLNMHDQTLTRLYRVKPSARGHINRSVGYAVFSNANVKIVFAAFGGGYGVVVDKKTGKRTFMRMGEVGIGLGLGVKDFRAVIVFHSRRTMRRFVERGWQFGGQFDAAAKASDKGGAVSGEAMSGRMTIYQLTKTGLALQATLKGTKFWKDPDLN